MVKGWKGVAMVVAIVVIIAAITVYALGGWDVIVNGALCAIQKNIGIAHHFHIPTQDGAIFACNP